MGFQWQVAPTDVFPQAARNYTQTIIASGRRVSHSRAQEAEQWLKDNAPWQDRTGDARRGLSVTVNEAPSVLAELVFSHDPALDYTIWLEVANGGKYAIIARAIDYWGPILMRDIQRIINLGLAAR